MIKFPLNDNSVFIVIEPGNLRRMKQGKPLMVELPNGSSAMVAFTPDANTFLAKLGFTHRMPEMKGHVIHDVGVHITPEQLDAALKSCQHLPEVER